MQQQSYSLKFNIREQLVAALKWYNRLPFYRCLIYASLLDLYQLFARFATQQLRQL